MGLKSLIVDGKEGRYWNGVMDEPFVIQMAQEMRHEAEYIGVNSPAGKRWHHIADLLDLQRLDLFGGHA